MNYKTRLAFTMIELVFVIVIIGILASVAVPKLVATRDDAKVVELLAKTDILLNDLFGYFHAHGRSGLVSATLGDITHLHLTQSVNDCNSYRPNIIWSGKTRHICLNGIAVLKISTTSSSNPTQYVELTQENSSVGLDNNRLFQKLTNGNSGKKYYFAEPTIIY